MKTRLLTWFKDTLTWEIRLFFVGLQWVKTHLQNHKLAYALLALIFAFSFWVKLEFLFIPLKV